VQWLTLGSAEYKNGKKNPLYIGRLPAMGVVSPGDGNYISTTAVI